MTKFVQLHIYEHEKEQTIVNDLAAETWDQFLILKIDGFENANLDNILQMAQDAYPDRKIFILDGKADVSFLGVREVEDESGPASLQSQQSEAS